ncbi:hypothetical protein EASAB2608_03144 [Streptomyces sp. EAS-AB2608]|nr:hypothetical protein EASAB2608_03144 [Streptomyces sp. EAS-AB2608]
MAGVSAGVVVGVPDGAVVGGLTVRWPGCLTVWRPECLAARRLVLAGADGGRGAAGAGPGCRAGRASRPRAVRHSGPQNRSPLTVRDIPVSPHVTGLIPSRPTADFPPGPPNPVL